MTIVKNVSHFGYDPVLKSNVLFIITCQNLIISTNLLNFSDLSSNEIVSFAATMFGRSFQCSKCRVNCHGGCRDRVFDCVGQVIKKDKVEFLYVDMI